MAVYSVNYDLHKVRNYKALWEFLEALGGKRILESNWIVASNATATAIRDAVQQYVDGDDAIAVLELRPGGGWAATWAKPGGVAMLRTYVHA